MNCEEIQALLVTYLDGEVTPSERMLIQVHLSGCTVCQQELDLLSTARSQVRSALQRRASQAVPSQDAWSRLEARLPKLHESFLQEAAQPSSKQLTVWLARNAPGVSRASNQFFGGVRMQKRWIFSGLAGAIVLSVMAILVARNVTPVSAREILDRAYSAQSAQSEGEGILHTRIETYQNLCARPEGQGGTITTVMDSYLDPRTGYFRSVSTEAKTGAVLEVFAFDGSHIYTGHRSMEVKDGQPEDGPESGKKQVICDQRIYGPMDGTLTVYRGTQSNVTSVSLPKSEDAQTNEEMFQKMRSDPNAELLGKQTWVDGRAVFALRSWQPVKAFIEGSTEPPMGWMTSYFDEQTYKIVESRATIERNGKDLLVYSYRVLADEVLPLGSYRGWDLSDQKGITIVDDPEGQHVDFLPEVISEQELASHTQSAYLLSRVPDGFKLEISAAPKQSKDPSFSYVASYRNEAGDYFVIQPIGTEKLKFVKEGSGESYITASGWKLTFMDDSRNRKSDSGKQFTSAILETSEGTAFVLNSTLTRETVKAWVEELALVKQSS
jgi:putative zinc finger protein